MRRMTNAAFGICGLFLALSSCNDDGTKKRQDGYVPPQRDGIKNPDKGPPPVKISWTTNTLDSDHAGLHLALAATGSLLGISYYRELDQDVTVDCPASGVTPGGPRARPAFDLLYLHHDGTKWGTPVKVDQTIGAKTYGTSVVFDKASKKVFVGYLGGTQMSLTECASNDAVIASSTNYTTFTKRTVSSAGSYAGDTVGYWMSVAVNSKGEDHAAHKDVLFGYYEADGKLKANPMYDNEVIGGVNGPQYKKGGGDYMSMAFDATDQPVVAFFNPVQMSDEGGIQVAVKKGASWSLQQVVTGATSERISLATNGKGVFGISFYDPGQQLLRYTESPANLASWAEVVVDQDLTHNGEFSSLAFDSKGQPAIAYYRCGAYNSSTCNLGKDGLMFAYRLNNTWHTWEVDQGGLNRCGVYASLVFTASDKPVIAYQCVALDNKTNQFIDALKVAQGAVQ